MGSVYNSPARNPANVFKEKHTEPPVVSLWWQREKLPLNNRFLVDTTLWFLPKKGSDPESQINYFRGLGIKFCCIAPEGPRAWRSWSPGSSRCFQSSALSWSEQQCPEWLGLWLVSLRGLSRFAQTSQSTLQVPQPSRSGTWNCFRWSFEF